MPSAETKTHLFGVEASNHSRKGVYHDAHVSLSAPPPPEPKVEAPKPVPEIPGTPIKLERGSIFKPTTMSPRRRLIEETLSSDGSAAKVLSEASSTLGKLPSLFLAQVSSKCVALFYFPMSTLSISRENLRLHHPPHRSSRSLSPK